MTILETVIDQWQFQKWQFQKFKHTGSFTENVIDRSMTIFSNTMSLYAPLQKLSLIDQWQFSQTPCPSMHLYRKCHWSINDDFLKHHVPACTFTENVIDRSMTIFPNTFGIGEPLQKVSLIDQWQFSSNTFGIGEPLQNCHWSINDNFPQTPLA